MAFVLVQHLAPVRDSALAEILSRATSLPVTEVISEREVEPNHVYVIPPDRDMTIVGGNLHLVRRKKNVSHHPIDLFFRSLAEEQREGAIGVVLSGTATDGTLGLEAIKAEGGITFAQDDSAQYDGMPRSAIASGCVDFALPPEGIAAELARISKHPYVRGAGAGQNGGARSPGLEAERAALAPILQVLRTATAVDFSLYKPGTLARRISRRMGLLKIEGAKDYARLLRDTPAEVEALYLDILINVTSFFRDPEAYRVLKAKVIPALLKDRSRHDPVRVWVLGCSTGEEAYSLAMLFSETMTTSKDRAPAQIFATDINAASIEHARAGVYDSQRVHDVSRERLRSFFTEQSGSYRVVKHIRDMCVFARHNVMADPPFSRIDLISCRNLLIYLEPSLQQRIIPLLHYALNPSGYLLLGSSETIGSFRELFRVENARHKLYSKKPGPGRVPLGLPVPLAGAGVVPDPPAKVRRAREPGEAPAPLPRSLAPADLPREADRLLLARFAPPGVLVNADLEILQFRGNTEPYLTPAQGKASLSLVKMARPGLLVPLQALMRRVKKEFVPVRSADVRIESDGGEREFNLEIVPIRGSATSQAAFLILFENAAPAAGLDSPSAKRKHSARAGLAAARTTSAAQHARIEDELANTREYLQALMEQQDAANEELQSANEEAQSANEELQSINEELETSKEEIQSSNEELTTVNDELQNRNLETAQLNGDLTNLISSIQTAIVIVGRDLHIRRSSPMAEKLFRIIPADIGRPITDISMHLELPELDVLLAEAIDTVSVHEREVQDKKGCWYSLHVRPYMTLENKIDGAVLMLVDIDGLKRAEQSAATARDYAEAIVESARDPLLILDADLRVRTANEAFYRTFQVGAKETEGRSIFELGNHHWKIPELRQLLEEILPRNTSFNGFEVTRDFESIGRRALLLNARALGGADQHSILVGIQDITEHLHVQTALKRSEHRYRRIFEAAQDGVLLVDPTSRKILDANPFMTELLGYAREELMGKELYEIGLLKDEAASQAAFRELKEKEYIRYEDLPLETKAGQKREVEMVSNLYQEAEDTIIQCNIRDITERKMGEAAVLRSEKALSERVEELAAIDTAKAQFLAVLSHELRSPLNAIRGWLRILQRPERTEEDLRKGLDVIDRNSRLQIELISDLLDAHRIGAGKTSLDLRNIDLREAIDAALATAEPAAAERQIRFEREIDPAPAPVSADPGRLQQVLDNLITNALKFTPRGGRIGVAMRRTDTHVQVSVTDTGSGIRPEALPHIFEPFRQAESQTTRRNGGLGLGLSIARQILQLHAGTIEAKSPGHGQGATFTITLPLRSLEESARQSVLSRMAPETRPGMLGGVMVLVVDDEPDAREPVRRVLEEAGAEVVAVSSAAEALAALRQQRPDVLVSDIGMPDQDGYELMRSIQALPPGRGGRVPAIALSSYAASEDRDRALLAGFKAHLAKPVEPSVLIAAIAALVSPVHRSGKEYSQ